MSGDRSSDPLPADWPVLVTGAGGFVGGHIARGLAQAGHRVRGLTRRPPVVRPGDPPIEWIVGDLRESETRLGCLEGMRVVVHTASWVSLGSDSKGQSRSINVEATRDLLADAARSGIDRLVYTSTIHTLAAGNDEAPADEDTLWNLDRVDSPYSRSKREAERLVLEASSTTLATVAICPGMVLGPRDIRPTSTKVLLALARAPVALLPRGGIPIVDTEVIALAHRRALTLGEPGHRYAVVGPYLSYLELAALVARVTGRPKVVWPLPDAFRIPLTGFAGLIHRLGLFHRAEVSATSTAGAFLRLHVRGERADALFGLVHPPPIHSIFAALDDAKRSGLAPWLRISNSGIGTAR